MESLNDIRVLIIVATNMLGGPGKGIFQLLRTNKARRRFSWTLVNFRRGRELTEFMTVAEEQELPVCMLEQHAVLDPTLIGRALRLVRETNANLVQTHGYKSHILAVVIRALIPNVRWIAWAHGWTQERGRVRLYNWLEKRLIRYADSVVAVSPALFETVGSWRGAERPTHLVVNAVEPQARSDATRDSLRSSMNVDSNCFLIGVIGRLSPEKGHSVVIEATHRLRNMGIHMKAVFVGDGPLRGELANEVMAAGLEGEVILCGHKRNVNDYLAAMDVMVLPSFTEGFPNVLLEAMASETPVVASSVGAIPTVVEDGVTGWLVSPGDVEELVTILKRVAETPALGREIARNAHDMAISNFSPDDRYRRVVKIYESELGRRSER